MIKMICGSTQVRGKLYSVGSGPFEADAAAEAYLVSRGAAEYVRCAACEPVATADMEQTAIGASVDTSETEKSAERHLAPEQLEGMKFDQLKALAQDMGLEVKKLRSKADLIEAIQSVEIYTEEVDSMPELEAGAPVV